VDFISVSNLIGLPCISIAPENLTYSSDSSFLYDKEQTSIFHFFQSDSTIEISSQISAIETHAFGWRTSLRCVIFPPDSPLQRIESFAFRAAGLISIVIPPRVAVIREYGFNGCMSLRSVRFSEGSQLKEIEAYAFASCPCISTISIPEKCEILGQRCFAWCSALREVVFEQLSQVKRIGDETFAMTDLERVCLPSDLEYVGENAFPGQCNIEVGNGGCWSDLGFWAKAHRITPGAVFAGGHIDENDDWTMLIGRGPLRMEIGSDSDDT
jgi:hypothetical protein